MHFFYSGWVNDTWSNTGFSGASSWSNVTKGVNSTVGVNIAWRVYANDTSNNWNASDTYSYNTTSAGYLDVSLVDPSPGTTTDIDQNSTFTVNSTVYCRLGNCGNVYGTVRYNASSPNPDTAVNTTTGDKPFFVQESSALAMKACPTNPLNDVDEFCNITWTINATGDYINSWKIGVLFNSSTSAIVQNHTGNATKRIIECLDSVSYSWSSIDFGTFIPSTNYNKAPGNNNKLYNITNLGTCTMTVWIKGTDLQNTTLPYPNIIGVGNLSWSNTTNVSTTSYNMTQNYVILNSSFTPTIRVITTYYWLSVPAVYAGKYNGTMTLCMNTSQQSGQANSCP